MHSSVWLPGAVAIVVLLLLVSLVCTRTPGDRFSSVWEIGVLLLAPWPLAYFQLITTTTAFWITGGLAFSVLTLVVGAEMNRPNGSRLPYALSVVLAPVYFLVLFLYWFLGLVMRPVWFVLRLLRK